jgi:hypothetical protein
MSKRLAVCAVAVPKLNRKASVKRQCVFFIATKLRNRDAPPNLMDKNA